MAENVVGEQSMPERMPNIIPINKILEGFIDKPGRPFITVHRATGDLREVYIAVFLSDDFLEVLGPMRFDWAEAEIVTLLVNNGYILALDAWKADEIIVDVLIRYISSSLAKVILRRNSTDQVTYDFVFEYGQTIRYPSAKSEELSKLVVEPNP